MDRVYEIRLPAEIRRLLQQLSFIISLGFEGVPLSCLGAKGYVLRLLLSMLLPCLIVLILLIVMLARLQVARRVPKVKSRHATREFSQHEHLVTKTPLFVRAITEVTPMILRIFFLAYPIVTNVAFEAFSCFEFEGASSWLIADVSIECGTDEHAQTQALAWIAIIIYPVGLILLNALLLVRARRAIEFGPQTELSMALNFLHSEYKPQLL